MFVLLFSHKTRTKFLDLKIYYHKNCVLTFSIWYYENFHFVFVFIFNDIIFIFLFFLLLWFHFLVFIYNSSLLFIFVHFYYVLFIFARNSVAMRIHLMHTGFNVEVYFFLLFIIVNLLVVYSQCSHKTLTAQATKTNVCYNNKN